MIKLDISNTSFIHDVPSCEGDDWLEANVGKIKFENMEGSRTVGEGWTFYFNDDHGHDDHGHWFIEFEDEKHASLFLLRWS